MSTFSYSGVVGYGKSSLPSVEAWGSNLNLLRSPPSSIQTRKIDKVGSTISIVEMIDEANDRAVENIRVYARGVNPSVSTSYQNNGGKQAYLPYRVNREGAFRPPIRPLEDLLPLSRQNRIYTSSFSKPGFADFSKKAMCPDINDKRKGINASTLKGCVRPTQTFKMNFPLSETYEVKNVVKTNIAPSVSSHKTQNRSSAIAENYEQPSGIREDPLHYSSTANKSDVTYLNNINFDTSPYINDKEAIPYESIKSRNIQLLSLEDIYDDNVSDHIRDPLQVSSEGTKRGYTSLEYIHKDMELERNIPSYDATSSISANIHRQSVYPLQKDLILNRPNTEASTNNGGGHLSVIDHISSRDYKLHPTVSLGGFSGDKNLPTTERNSEYYFHDSSKSEMRDRIYKIQNGR